MAALGFMRSVLMMLATVLVVQSAALGSAELASADALGDYAAGEFILELHGVRSDDAQQRLKSCFRTLARELPPAAITQLLVSAPGDVLENFFSAVEQAGHGDALQICLDDY
jgi:hypothetical protein